MEQIGKEFFKLANYPTYRIIENSMSICQGMATLHKSKAKQKNSSGIKIRYTISDLYLKRTILKKERFYDALSTYIHELCHMFGGDSSESFSLALSDAITLLLENREIVQEAYKKWIDNFENKTDGKETVAS